MKSKGRVVVLKKTDTIEERNRKISSVSMKSTEPSKEWDINQYCGAIKDVYGDGLEYQKKVRAEWDKDLTRLLINGPVMDDKQFKAFKNNRKRFD